MQFCFRDVFSVNGVEFLCDLVYCVFVARINTLMHIVLDHFGQHKHRMVNQHDISNTVC